MDYYIIKQNEIVMNNVDLSNYDLKNHKEDSYICINGKISEFRVEVDYTTKKVLFEKVHFVSDNIKEVFDMFRDDIVYRPLVISDTRSNKQLLFWEINLASLSAIENELNNKVSIEKALVFDKTIFVIFNKQNNFIVIREDIVECILKRRFNGVEFVKVNLV